MVKKRVLEGKLHVIDNNADYHCSTGPAYNSYIGDIMILDTDIGGDFDSSIFEEFIDKRIRLTIEVIDDGD